MSNELLTLRGCKRDALDQGSKLQLEAFVAKAKYDAIRMVQSAGSGHIGGSLSSAECLALALLCTDEHAGDRVIVSHGHIAPIYYSLLGNMGYFDPEMAIAGLRKGGVFEGHPSLKVPGVRWCSGMLGQGLSVGAGFALAQKCKGKNGRVVVLMGDGEQNKGQILEAARFAAKYQLDNLYCIVDWNRLQASGETEDVMPQNLEKLFVASGCSVEVIDGHDLDDIYNALRNKSDCPKVILAKTIMSNGVKEVENDYHFHGALPPAQILDRALGTLCRIAENAPVFAQHIPVQEDAAQVVLSDRIVYKPDKKYACRDAVSRAVLQACEQNPLLTVLDCDLVGSMKLQSLQNSVNGQLIECGISEHNAASVAAGLAKAGVPSFWFDFGVLNLDEAYSQIRMAQINKAPIKLISTHCGLDVGEDGKTHQCTDYIGVASQLYDVRLIIPADANQADAAVQEMLRTDKMSILACGRSALPVILDEAGEPLYAKSNCLGTTIVRQGDAAAIFACGTMVHKAVNVAERLKQEGICVRVINVSEPLALTQDWVLDAAQTGIVITYEDHNVRTGLGSIVASKLAGRILCQFKQMGLQEHGGSACPDSLFERAGLSEDDLYRELTTMLQIKA